MTDARRSPQGINPNQANAARMYDYYLGGENNFPVDREAAEKVLRIAPWIRPTALENREFLHRAVNCLVREAGVRQLVDIGTGLPTQGSVHEVAHAIEPDTRVVYVDNDPFVLAQSRALLADTPNAITIRADLRYPAEIITHPQLVRFIDWDQPVGLLLVAILHFLVDEDDPTGILEAFRDAMAPGSHVVISHVHHEGDEDAVREIVNVYRNANVQVVMRTTEQTAQFFDGFDLLDPRLVPLPEWRPEQPPNALADIWGIGGVGRLRT